jgi:AbiU2
METAYETKQVFLALREQCQWLDANYTTFCALYESGEERRKLLSDTAPAFFYEHNLILQQHCILQVCKLTDSAETRMNGMAKKNLTFKQVNSMLESEGCMTAEIKRLSENLEKYREIIVKSRHWIISHFDLDTYMAGVAVGAHEKTDLTDFLESMYRYTDAVGDVLGVGPLNYKGTSGPGDALDLMKHLQKSLRYSP